MNEEKWDKAIARLNKRWEKRDAKWCAWGAIRHAARDGHDELEALDVVARIAAEQYPERTGYAGPGLTEPMFLRNIGSVAQFNDHTRTTLDDVIAVFEKARVEGTVT